MSKKLLSMLITVGAIGLSSQVFADTINKDQYKAEKDRISAEYKADKQNCGTMSGNAKDICKAEASGKKNVAEADDEANYKPTSKNRMKAQTARADAAYDVQKEKCDDLAGNDKSVCRKDAKAAYVHAKADAKAGKEIRDARKDAASDKRDADYAAVKQRCDSLAGDAKSQCQSNAKAQFGKS
jgi:hypothetical protein